MLGSKQGTLETGVLRLAETQPLNSTTGEDAAKVPFTAFNLNALVTRAQRRYPAS